MDLLELENFIKQEEKEQSEQKQRNELQNSQFDEEAQQMAPAKRENRYVIQPETHLFKQIKVNDASKVAGREPIPTSYKLKQRALSNQSGAQNRYKTINNNMMW